MRVLLALPLVVTAACGDNLPGPQDPNTDGADQSGATETDTTARYLPEICSAQTFGSVQLDAKASVIRAVPYDLGAALFVAPKAGGVARGVLVDGRGNVMGDQAGYKLRSDLTVTSLSASRVDDRFIVGFVADGQTHITALRDDLGDYRELAVAEGSMVGERTVMRARNVRVTATGGANGLVATTFDNAWQSMGSQVIESTVPTSLTTAAYGTDAMMAWSTDSECHVQRVAADDGSMRPYPCQNARIAVDYMLRGGWMVYERDGGVMISQIDVNGHNMIANQRQLVANGRSPRIAYDGTTFWASYVDVHGDVVVGLLDETGDLDSTAINGVTPTTDGYDLAVAHDSAWVYAVDGGRLGGTRICKAQQ